MAPRIGPEPESPELSTADQFLHAIPFGLGIRNKPRYFLDVLRSFWENRQHPLYARKILKSGVCDGCSLGPAGLRDDVTDGTHLCSLRLRDLSTSTSEAIAPAVLADVTGLREADAGELRQLGRIPSPLQRFRGENGLTPVSWDEALDLIGERLKGTDPRRAAWFTGARSLSNEGAFATAQAARTLKCPNLDSSARFGYAAAATGIADVFGIGAPTCSLKDLLGTDLLVLWGVDPSASHPVLLKYLHIAKEQGTRVAVVDPRREERLVKYWIPHIFESALWGTRLLDDHYGVREGGDLGFVLGVLKTLEERSGFDQEFVNSSASGLDELARKVREAQWSDLERASGLKQAGMERFAGIYSSARTAVFAFGSGVTGQRNALDTVRALSTLAAVRGMVGKKRCGILPLGHGGEQGAIDLGIAPAPGGLTAPQMIKAAQEGRLDFFFSLVGDLFEAPVDRAVTARSLERIGVRVHAGTHLDPSMMVAPGDVVLILPSMTRYESTGGSTSTSVERRLRFSPEIPGPRPSDARPEWRIPLLIAQRVDLANERQLPWTDAQSLRGEIERSVPRYKGIAGLKEEGQWIQWGGERLFEKGRFDDLPGGKCRLHAPALPDHLPG